jgi:hypothetical protein
LEKKKEAESAQGFKIKDLKEKVELGVEELNKAKVQVSMRWPMGNLDLSETDAYRYMPKEELALIGKFFLCIDDALKWDSLLVCCIIRLDGASLIRKQRFFPMSRLSISEGTWRCWRRKRSLPALRRQQFWRPGIQS